MNLTRRMRQNSSLHKRASLAAGSVQTIVEQHLVVKHVLASHGELNLSRATATPGVDRMPLLRVELRVCDGGRGFDPTSVQLATTA